MNHISDAEIREAILTRLTVPLWPHAGRAVGSSRNATYDSARRGDIPTLDISRKKPVPTSWLRQKLGLQAV